MASIGDTSLLRSGSESLCRCVRPRTLGRNRCLPSSSTASATSPRSASTSRCPIASQTASTACVSAVSSSHTRCAISNAVLPSASIEAATSSSRRSWNSSRSAISSTVVVDLGPVAREQQVELHRRGAAEPVEVLRERPPADAARRLERNHLGARGDLRQEVVADDRDAVLVVDEERVGDAVARALDDPVARGRRRGRRLRRRGRRSSSKFALFRTMCSQNGSLDSITFAGTPCAARRRRPNAASSAGPLVVARAPRSRARRRGDAGARPSPRSRRRARSGRGDGG